jgi:hypothetical protein
MLALLVCLTDGDVFTTEHIRADIHALILPVVIRRLLLNISICVQMSIFILLSHSLVEVLFLIFANELAVGLKLAREVYAKPHSGN